MVKKLLALLGIGFAASQVFGNSRNNSNPTTVGEGKIDFSGSPLSEARSTRNNNPGNVKKPGANKWEGTKSYDEVGHAIFKNYIFGTRAMILDVLAKIKRGENTINKFLPIYCPKSDGCPIAEYIAFVERESGVNKNTVLNANGKVDKNTLYRVLQAMAYYEGGKYSNGSYKTKFNRWFFDEAIKLIGKNANIGKTKKTKFFDVYSELPNFDSNGKTNLNFTKGKTGVYIIKENNVIVYVGKSNSDLYKTIMRHFQRWNDRQQPDRVTYKNKLSRKDYTIRVVLAKGQKIHDLERGLILKYQPRDNKQKYDFFYESNEDVREVIQEATELVNDAPTYYPPEWDF